MSVIISTVMVAIVACDPFGAGNTSPPSSEGGVVVGDDGGDGAGDANVPLTKRDVHITIDWPTVAALDPRADPRIREMRIHIGPSTSQTFPAGNNQTYDIAGALIPATGVVDVTIEVKGGDPPERLIAFGARRKFRIEADGVIPVAVRRRILYLTSSDRGAGNGELRALEGAPPSGAEPALSEPSEFPALPTLREPIALWVTSDGLQLVQGGVNGTTPTGSIAIYATGTHTQDPDMPAIALPAIPMAISPLGEDGYKAVVAYGERTTFDVVDLKTRAVRAISTGIVGGVFPDSSGAPASADGHAAIVFHHRPGGSGDKPFLAIVSPATEQVTALVPLDVHMDAVRAVRFAPDGKRIVVAGYRNEGTWSTGILAIFDAANPAAAAPKIVRFAPTKARPTALVFTSDDGKHVFVSNETNYSSPNCCNEPRIINLETGQETWAGTMTQSGPSHELLTALRLPYAPFRVFGGQSDNGNNTNGPMVEINAPTVAPTRLTIITSRDFGSFHGFASPFATQL